MKWQPWSDHPFVVGVSALATIAVTVVTVLTFLRGPERSEVAVQLILPQDSVKPPTSAPPGPARAETVVLAPTRTVPTPGDVAAERPPSTERPRLDSATAAPAGAEAPVVSAPRPPAQSSPQIRARMLSFLGGTEDISMSKYRPYRYTGMGPVPPYESSDAFTIDYVRAAIAR